MGALAGNRMEEGTTASNFVRRHRFDMFHLQNLSLINNDLGVLYVQQLPSRTSVQPPGEKCFGCLRRNPNPPSCIWVRQLGVTKIINVDQATYTTA
eukprot:scaffold4518_cov149-Cylindrotheca_fusiformis.AAC.8